MTARAARDRGFADLHSHVLYGMDDGAKTREDSLSMLALAAQSGTADIVASPHANGRFRYDGQLIDQQIADLNASVEGIRIHRGCDFELEAHNIEDAIAHPRKYTINGGVYLLVEFPHMLRHTHAEWILKRLVDAGLVPIVTHPERVPLLQTRIEDLARWVGNGCWIQITAGSVTGAFGRQAQRFSDALVRRGLVQVVASDAHDCTRRPPSLREAYDDLSRRFGETAIQPLFERNPRAAIAGARLDISVVPLKPLRRWPWLHA